MAKHKAGNGRRKVERITVSTRVRPALWRELRKLAVEKGVSAADLVDDAIERLLKRYKRL